MKLVMHTAHACASFQRSCMRAASSVSSSNAHAALLMDLERTPNLGDRFSGHWGEEESRAAAVVALLAVCWRGCPSTEVAG